MRIELNFEYLEKLKPEKYWSFVEGYGNLLRGEFILAERDYAKKKGWSLESITTEQRTKMHKAINQRRILKEMSQNLLKLNIKPFYKMFGKE